MKILVIGPSWIGDMMMSQSLYRTLLIRYPMATIDVTSSAWCYSLLSRMPEVNEVIPMEFNHGALEIRARYRFGHQLRKKRYDRTYILPNSLKSALVPFFANIPHRIGWRGEMRYGLINDMRILDKKSWPMMVERYIALAYDKGVMKNSKDLPYPLLWPHLQVFEKERFKMLNAFNFSPLLRHQMIGFCPGSEFGPAKRWPHFHYAELAKLLIETGYQILIFGSAKDNKIGQEIFSALNIKQQNWCYDMTGKTCLEQALILISACKAIVTNDSGLMHIAAATDRPLIALYGPSNPDFTPPLSNKSYVIRLSVGYHKVRKGNAEYGYQQSLINISPQYVMSKLSDLLMKKTTNNARFNY